VSAVGAAVSASTGHAAKALAKASASFEKLGEAFAGANQTASAFMYGKAGPIYSGVSWVKPEDDDDMRSLKSRQQIEGGVFEHAGITIALATSRDGWAALFGVEPGSNLPNDAPVVALPSHLCGRFVSAKVSRVWTEFGWSMLTDGNRTTFTDAQQAAKPFAERLRAVLDERPRPTRRIRL
jgi:hypothetical protein